MRFFNTFLRPANNCRNTVFVENLCKVRIFSNRADCFFCNFFDCCRSAAEKKFIPIPQIRITDSGAEEYIFMDFELDITPFNHEPLVNEMLIQNLENQSDRQRIDVGAIDFGGYKPEKLILDELRKKPEIDYNKCKTLLFKLI